MEILLGIVILIIIVLIFFRRQADGPVRYSYRVDTIPSRPRTMRRHQDAARYIRESDDAFAKAELEQIKNRPEAYNYYFNKHADHNRTLKIALGLVAGYLTWEMLNDDNREAELQAAMTQLEGDLENDTVPREDNIVEQEEAGGYDDSDYGEDLSSEDEEMDRLYADLDDTQYFEDMMDD